MPGWYGAEDRGHRRLKELVWGGRLARGEGFKRVGRAGLPAVLGSIKIPPRTELSAV